MGMARAVQGSVRTHAVCTARLTEEYRQLHNDREDCTQPFGMDASARDIITHLTQCAHASEYDFVETTEYAEQWEEEGFWIRTLRMPHHRGP